MQLSLTASLANYITTRGLVNEQTARYLNLQDVLLIKPDFLYIYLHRRLNAVLTYFYHSCFTRLQFSFVKTDSL